LNTKLKNVIWAIFSIIAGVCSYGLSPALITFICFEKFIPAYQTKSLRPFLDKKLLISLFFILLGTIIIVSAPGNLIRADASDDAFRGNVLFNLVLVNLKFIGFGWPLIPLSFIFTMAFNDQLPTVSFSKWLLTALATASPLAVLNSFTSPRTAIFFHFFFTIFLIISFKTLFERYRLEFKFSNFASYFMAGVFFFLIIKDHFQAYHFHQEYSSQIKALEQVRNTPTSFIFKEPPSSPKSLSITTFSKESGAWDNQCAANYYGVDSIQLE
jgi:hypothetical protein